MTTQTKSKPATPAANPLAFTLRSCLTFFMVVAILAALASLIDTITVWMTWSWLHKFNLLSSMPNWPGAVLFAIVFNYCSRWRVSLTEIKNEDASSLTVSAAVNWMLMPILALIVVAVFTLVASLLGLSL